MRDSAAALERAERWLDDVVYAMVEDDKGEDDAVRAINVLVWDDREGGEDEGTDRIQEGNTTAHDSEGDGVEEWR